jgi:anti-anti-sigma regulatory factor
MDGHSEPADAVRLRIDVDTQPDAVRIVFRGEADFSDVERLHAVLDRVPVEDGRPVHIDMAELGFADVATLRELTLFAQRARAAGHNVTTWGARSIVRKVAHILHWDGDLGLA